MTTRETSRTAFQQLIETGELIGQQAKILAALVRMGPSTSGEVFEDMEIRNVNAWRARITELQQRGLIVEVAQRKCKISGRLALVWEYTGRLKPLPMKGKATSGKELRELITRAGSLLKSKEPLAAAVSQWFASAKAAGIKL